MKEYISNSYDETLKIAANLAKELPKGAVIGFIGGLGMGKTAFTAGFVKGLGIDCDVFSPTFAICNEYIGAQKCVYHFDMYRIESWDDLYSTGFFDYLDSGAYILAEWSENIFGALPEDSIIVEIEKTGENARKIKIMNKAEVID